MGVWKDYKVYNYKPLYIYNLPSLLHKEDETHFSYIQVNICVLYFYL